MFSNLIGKRFNSISRAVDMLCLCLGENFPFVTPAGHKREAAEYAFHLQTQWRFREEGTILLASRDVYEPYAEDVPEDWEYDLVGRPDALSSVFDVESTRLTEKMKDAYVVACSLSAVNDLTICFSNGVVFEPFMPASRRDEEWRLIDFKKDVHTVCYDMDGRLSQDEPDSVN